MLLLVFHVMVDLHNGEGKCGDGAHGGGWGKGGGRGGVRAVEWGACVRPRAPCLAGATCKNGDSIQLYLLACCRLRNTSGGYFRWHVAAVAVFSSVLKIA